MDVSKYGFTQNQLNELIKFIEMVQNGNKIGSKYRIDAVQFYRDRGNNILISYVYHDVSQGVVMSSLGYKQIDAEGNMTDLTKIYSSIEAIVSKLEKCEEIKID
jgi:hypothetical protein